MYKIEEQILEFAFPMLATIALSLLLFMTWCAIFYPSKYKIITQKHYEIQDIGTAERPVQAAVIDKKIINISDMGVILYNVELYYLEETIYSCGYCPERKVYSIVPKSYVEEQ